MTKTFLTQKFAPEDMDKRRTLGLKLNRISDENAVGLLNDLRSMSVDELWSFVSKISEAIHVPVLNRLAVQVLPELTGLRHDTTLRMIGLCVKGCTDDTEPQKQERIAGVVKLIRGYRHRTNLNLLPELQRVIQPEGTTLIAGDHTIDLACADHLQRALQKTYTITDLTSMVKVIGELQLSNTLGTLVAGFKEAWGEKQLEMTISDLYYQDALTPDMIASIRAVHGDKTLIEHAQFAMHEGQGKASLSAIIQVLGEDRVITDALLDQAMAKADGDVKKSGFLETFTHGKSVPLEHWPKTMDFVYKNLPALTANSDSIFQSMFIKHSVEHGHAHLLVDVCINRLKAFMMKADQQLERSDFGSFDYAKSTHADILNRTFDKFYEVNWRDAQLKTWRWSVMDVIQEAGILEFSDMAEQANSRVRAEMIEAIGEPENKVEILQKLVKFRGGWFTQELGV